MRELTPLTDAPSRDKMAYEKIKEAIQTFRFLPNQALIEGELAAQLGISKTPVRDALMRLEKEGLVTRVPFKGTYVTDISNQDMADLYMISIALEGLAIQLATDSLTEEDFRQLDELIQAHEKALKTKDVLNGLRYNREFHSIIINRSANPHLVTNLAWLDAHLNRYRLLSIAQGFRSEKTIPEHAKILEALKERDARKAEEAMRSHLESAMKDLYNQDFSELEQALKNLNI
jgi:DNA-binding GntR family transcriptional regulator